jgi:hypothetical protein
MQTMVAALFLSRCDRVSETNSPNLLRSHRPAAQDVTCVRASVFTTDAAKSIRHTCSGGRVLGQLCEERKIADARQPVSSSCFGRAETSKKRSTRCVRCTCPGLETAVSSLDRRRLLIYFTRMTSWHTRCPTFVGDSHTVHMLRRQSTSPPTSHVEAPTDSSTAMSRNERVPFCRI